MQMPLWLLANVVFFQFFLGLEANILDNKLGERIDLRKDCRDQAVSGVKLFIVLSICSEVADLVQLYLVALLGYNLEVLKYFI